MKVINEGRRQLSLVDMADYDAGNISANDFKKLAPDFHMFFRSLLKVKTVQSEKLKQREDKQEKKEPSSAKRPNQSTKPETTPATMPLSTNTIVTRSKRRLPEPLSIQGSVKRTKRNSPTPSPTPQHPITPNQSTVPAEPVTPDQPTVPSNPKFTSDSIESQDEEGSKELLVMFVECSFSALEDEFRRLKWAWTCGDSSLVELIRTYDSSIIPNLIGLGLKTMRDFNWDIIMCAQLTMVDSVFNTKINSAEISFFIIVGCDRCSPSR